ncbi:hypothetical protein [Stieleria sedimenti]|uniref:hypothetical protein n=1 Tax=Stieleria sedimenti TaxID=2976331 RepID=UPI00217F6102|nr:hypothetical protein [Stieleria sedimenti]
MAEFPDWSDKRIAEACDVSRGLVATVKRALSGVGERPPREEGDNESTTEREDVLDDASPLLLAEIDPAPNQGDETFHPPDSESLSCGACNLLKGAVKQGDLSVADANQLVDVVPDRKKQGDIVRSGPEAVRRAIESGGGPNKEKKTAYSKLKKTIESAFRANDDYHELVPNVKAHSDVLENLCCAMDNLWGPE